MERYRRVGRGAGRWMVLALAVVAPGCRDKATQAERSRATQPPAAASDRLPTDEELMAYLTWLRDWRELTLRNKEELDATTERVAARYSLADTGKVVEDPEMRAVFARIGESNKAHFDTKPSGRTIDAIQASLEGLGLNIPLFAYSGVRDEEALARARSRYGDAVVDWVVAREATVASMLSPYGFLPGAPR